LGEKGEGRRVLELAWRKGGTGLKLLGHLVNWRQPKGGGKEKIWMRGGVSEA